MSNQPLLIDDPIELLQYGIISKVPIVSDQITLEQWKKYAFEYIIITPEIMTNEGDGTYAFYRNILNEIDFPFDLILQQTTSTKNKKNPNNISQDNTANTSRDNDDDILRLIDEDCDNNDFVVLPTAIGQAILNSFPMVQSLNDFRLDDAFCIHYNMNQIDTTGAKHMDPSDITINICLDKSIDCIGSNVLFYGTKDLVCNHNDNKQDESLQPNDSLVSIHEKNDNNDMGERAALEITDQNNNDSSLSNFQFLVNQESGYATIHYGNHPHETTKLISGIRTNIILTYCYIDQTKSDVTTRNCYL